MKRFPDKITLGDKYNGILNVKTEQEAAEYLEACIEHHLRLNPKSREEAKKIELGNIGYYAGYFSREESERVWKLFNTEHPIFGKLQLTPEEAFTLGQRMGELSNLKNS